MRSVTTLCTAAAVIALLGCGNQVSETAAEKYIEEQAAAAGQDVDVELDDAGGTLTMESKDGRMEINSATGGGRIETEEGTVAFGADAALPENFPEDVPLYPGQKLLSVSTTADNDGFIVQASVPDTFDKVGAYYEKELGTSDWTEEMSNTVGGVLRQFAYTKEERILNVTLSKADTDDGPSTMISITVGNQ